MKPVLVLLVSAALALALALPAASQSPDTVNTFVTPENISITVSGGPIHYGSVPLSAADDSRQKVARGPLSITNNGSVTVNLSIHGTNAEPTSDPGSNSTWALNCTGTNGEVGQNQFVHKFAIGDNPADFETLTATTLCTSSVGAKALFPAVTPGGGPQFVLQIAMPTESTGYVQRQSDVIVTATKQP